jgi:hypothetical protein
VVTRPSPPTIPGTDNAAYGYIALRDNTASFNTAFGSQALVFNTEGDSNTAIGTFALENNTTGFSNTACGKGALSSNTTGVGNVAIGSLAGLNITTGNESILIRNIGFSSDNGVIRIGTTNTHTSTYVAGIAGQTVGMGGSTCYVDNEGKLGVFLSARRFKTNIIDMGNASEALLALRPVTFHYKPDFDNMGIPQFGLVAEEVAKVNPDLVTHDA